MNAINRLFFLYDFCDFLQIYFLDPHKKAALLRLAVNRS